MNKIRQSEKGEVFPQTWRTREVVPRKLTAKGRSVFDHDCLVAYFEGGDKAVWLLDNQNRKTALVIDGSGVADFGARVYADFLSSSSEAAPPPHKLGGE